MKIVEVEHHADGIPRGESPIRRDIDAPAVRVVLTGDENDITLLSQHVQNSGRMNLNQLRTDGQGQGRIAFEGQVDDVQEMLGRPVEVDDDQAPADTTTNPI